MHIKVFLEMKHRWETTIKMENSNRSCGSKNGNSLHTWLCYCSDGPAGDKLYRHKQLIITLPCASTGESFCSSNLATLKFPYFAARWSGVKPFFVVADRDAPCSSNTDATWMCENKTLVFFCPMTLEEWRVCRFIPHNMSTLMTLWMGDCLKKKLN